MKAFTTKVDSLKGVVILKFHSCLSCILKIQ